MKVQTTAARLQLACLLWATGTPVPQKLSGRPARTEALDLLRQCFQNLPYDEACCLRPRRLRIVVLLVLFALRQEERAWLDQPVPQGFERQSCQQGRVYFGSRACKSCKTYDLRGWPRWRTIPKTPKRCN